MGSFQQNLEPCFITFFQIFIIFLALDFKLNWKNSYGYFLKNTRTVISFLAGVISCIALFTALQKNYNFSLLEKQHWICISNMELLLLLSSLPWSTCILELCKSSSEKSNVYCVWEKSLRYRHNGQIMSSFCNTQYLEGSFKCCFLIFLITCKQFL